MEEIFICTKCKEELPKNDFYINKKNNYQYSRCKKCLIKITIEYQNKNKEKTKERRAKYYDRGKEKNLLYKKKNAGIIKIKRKKYYDKNRVVILRKHKERYHNDVDYTRKRMKKYRDENKERRSKLNKEKIKSLADRYIKTILIKGTPLSFKDITQSLIELKRAQMLINREIKNSKTIK